mmetsp:Transcript_42339/g.40588  ORF Transcript_42339/g.40588 Transcript_42339/m.40588 type:complete len:439 (-) Transcript_42339:717-2033(-)
MIDVDDEDTKEMESAKDKNKNDTFKNSIKSRKAFSMALNDKAIPSSIKRLNRTANVVLLCLIIFAILEYSFAYKQLADTILNFQLIQSSYLAISEIQKVCYNVRTLNLLNYEILVNFQGKSNSSELFQFVQGELQDSLELISTTGTELNLARLTVSPTHQALLEDASINITFQQDQGTTRSQKYSLGESLLYFQASLFSVANQDLSEFVDSNQDTFFIMDNSFGDFYRGLIDSANYYVLGLKERSAYKKEAYLTIFICSILVLLVISVIIVPVFQSVNKQKDKVLSLFCEIDDTNIRVLMQKCEKFLSKIELDDLHDDLESNEDDLVGQIQEEDDEYGGYVVSTRRIKRAKNRIKTQSSFYLRFFVAVLLTEVYYLNNYVSQRLLNTNISKLSEVMNQTSAAEPFYWLMLNTQREMFVDPNKTILGQNSMRVSIAGLD